MGLKLNGATSGSIEIDVPAVAGTDTAITIPATTGGEFIVSDSSGNIDLGPLDINGSASDDSVNIDSSGRLLVGTTSARANFFNSTSTGLFQVEGTGGGTNRATMSLTNNSSSNDGAWFVINRSKGSADGSNTVVTSGDSLGSIGWQGSDGSEFVFGATITAEVDGTPGANDMPGRLMFSTTADGASSPTEAVRITSGQRLRVGMANFASDVGSSNRGFEVRADGIILTGQPSTATQSHHLFYNPNGIVGSIQTNGSSTSFNTSSDYRLKENVVDLDGAITRVKQLAPKRFNFIADANKTVDGFIAHEAQTVVPEAVTGTQDETETVSAVLTAGGSLLQERVTEADWESGKIPDENGNTVYPTDSQWVAEHEVPVYQGIDQAKLVPLLTAALQEAIGKIEALETANASLEARLTALEGGAAQ